ncbi:uncharacterized protein LOC105647251 [Jatropha curcas]|uniref:uncharacterized protein LOC105647251 n=1 Tax=Jatropha curcas TaxID=180498 RepID=UPI001894A018|nr:uncharacterized protein LOC105647251 [Jatropha curcas]
MAKWVSVLAAYDLKFVQRKAVKGGALADQLAELPVEDQMPKVEFPDENLLHLENQVWEMYFDGASNYHGNGIGVVFKTPCGEYVPIAVKLDFDCTNNEAEYEACIKGKGFDEWYLVPTMVLCQSHNPIRDVPLVSYALASPWLNDIVGIQVHRLLSARPLTGDQVIRPLTVRLQKQPAHVMNLVDDKPWFWDIRNYLQNEAYPEGFNKTDQRTLRQLASGYFLGEFCIKEVGMACT